MNTKKQDHEKETSDFYGKVVARLSNRHRVIICRNHLQYILQRATTVGWQGFSYHVTGASLLRKVAQMKLPTEALEGLQDIVPQRQSETATGTA